MVNKKLIMVLAVSIILVFSLTVLKPTLSKSAGLKKETKSNKEKLSKLIDKAEKLESMDEKLIQKKVEQVEEILPSQKPIMDILNSLSLLSKNEGVEFEGISLEPGEIDEEKKQEKQELEIVFNVNGSLEQISSFVSKLQETPPLMKIEKMELKVVEKGKEEPQEQADSLLSTALTVKVYYQSLPENIGSIDQPLPILTEGERTALAKIESFTIFPKIQPTAAIGKEDLFSLP